MKFSRYNLIIPYKNKRIVYNLLNRSLILIKKMKDLNCLSNQEIKILKKEGILIENEVDEKKIFKIYYENQKYNSKELEFVIIPTYSCNLNCKYCYEGKKSKIVMNRLTIKKILKFIKKKVIQKNVKKFSLRFYGGEPLMQKEIILSILKKVNLFSKKNRIDFSVSIITNGTLLDKYLIQRLKKYPVTLAITLNGPKIVHDKNRPFIDGRGTYDIILKNLIEAKKQKLNTYLCINVDRQAHSHVIELLEDLISKNLKLPLNFGIILPIRSACNYLYPASTKILPELWELAVSKGFRVAIGEALPHNFSYCKHLTTNGFTIDPEGKLKSCIALSSNRFENGTINENGESSKNYIYYKWLSRDPLKIKKCNDCKILPVCCGGCPVLLENIESEKSACYLNERILKSRTKLYLKQKFYKNFKDLKID